ncbi:MAG TPA: DcaP family trimeric outer membrane transporter [Candidatus Sulfotelmatobacter sp.]|nr:DcaP family trimeric outer membrane transporter [Candidatus Sulfotelmatobacter sp.]
MKRALKMTALVACVLATLGASAHSASAQGTARWQIYGFAMLDAGFMTEGVNPQWFDTMRPSKLPAFKDEFNKDGQTFWGVRQSKIAVKTWTPTAMGELLTQFEFDMYGVGPDAGQTTIRPRIYYGELGHWGAGQIMSPFMDIDVFPNCLDYWGPNGMLFFRNPQIRFMNVKGENKLTVALERPGASGDLGTDRDEIVASGAEIVPSFPLPDLSGNFHMGQKWGYLQVGGIVRQIKWNQLNSTPTQDINGSVTGWGATVSGNFNRGKTDVLRFQGVYGEGIENYFNDAPVDVGTKPHPADLVNPIDGVALPISGVTVFLDHTWNEKYTSTIGYSQNVIQNSVGQAPDAFHMGQYALANVLYTPVKDVMMGVELGWEKRKNNTDGFDVDNVVVHASFKYNFSIERGAQ